MFNIRTKIKSLAAILIGFCLIMCFALSVSAEPRYSGNHSITLNLTFSDEKGAICYCSIIGDVGSTSISDCTITLTDSSGNKVNSWSDLSSPTGILTFSKSELNVKKGEKYTLSVTATVTRNGKNEIISDSVSATYKK